MGAARLFLALGGVSWMAGMARIIRATAMRVRRKSKKVNKAWLNDHVTDPYVKLAQKEGYRPRGLQAQGDRRDLAPDRPGQLVVDLGATPGAWSQYLRRKFAPKRGGRRAAVGR